MYAYYADPVEQQRQLRWLEQDLQNANANRTQRPWIIMWDAACWERGAGGRRRAQAGGRAGMRSAPFITLCTMCRFGHKCDWMDHTIFTEFGATVCEFSIASFRRVRMLGVLTAELAHKYGVDLYLCGHQHNYQASCVGSLPPGPRPV